MDNDNVPAAHTHTQQEASTKINDVDELKRGIYLDLYRNYTEIADLHRERRMDAQLDD